MLSDAWLSELTYKNDIADTIGRYTSLIPRGGKLWACCPFHHEKTPSFSVDREKQMFYCFGCHKGGNVITFIREIENLPDNFSAIKMLADRCGMVMPNQQNRQSEALLRKQKERLYLAVKAAAKFYYSNIITYTPAVDYLKKRDIPREIITRFGLGYSPDSWDALSNQLMSEGFSEEEIVQAGLARISAKNNKPYDFFRNRVMFPIIDSSANVLGFGGRTMGDDVPKYVNTAENIIYSKRNGLYAINMLKKGTLPNIILTEGYMDAIRLHSVGIDNAVASLGTALTKEQAILLARRTSTVYISYDGDSAGQAATLRGMDILTEVGLNVFVVAIPNNDDPDDYVRKFGKEGYMSLVENAVALNEFYLNCLAKGYKLDTNEGASEYAKAACKRIAKLQPVEQERYYRFLSDKTGISFSTLSKQGSLESEKSVALYTSPKNGYNTVIIAKPKPNKESVKEREAKNRRKHELTLALCARNDLYCAEYLYKNVLQFIEAPEVIAYISKVYESNKEGNATVPEINELLSKKGYSHIAGEIVSGFKEAVGYPSIMSDCVSGLKRFVFKEKSAELAADYSMGKLDKEAYKKALSELNALIKTG